MKKPKTRRPWAVALGAITVGAVAYACATPLVPEDVKLRPNTITAGSATSRSATVGTTIQNEPVVVINDQFGDPLPGVTVNFGVSSGTAPTPATKQTDDLGRASPTSWALPTTSGTVTLTATVPGANLSGQTFTVTLNPGPASAAAVNSTTPSSNNQSAVAGTPVAVLPQVKVTDQYGNAVPGVPVTFAVTGGGGAVVPTTPVNTDALGVAKVTSWTLGTALGANTLRATVTGIATPVTFTATGTAGAPASISVGGTGNSQGQTAVANTKVANAPVVVVRDANNNPVSGVTVRFTIASGNGKILVSSTDNTGQGTQDLTTDANGTASIFGWRLGSVGTNTLNVSLPDYTSVTTFVFTATGTVGPPSQITVSSQAWSFTQASSVHGGSPSVLVRDVGGNAVPSATVTWTTPDANSSLSGAASSTTSASGIAAFPRGTVNWTAGATVGATMTLTASVNGTSLTQNFTSRIVGAPSAMTKHAGDNQSGSINTPLATRPAVKVVDAAGDPVPGVSVTFQVTSGGGSVTGTPVNTDSVGVATVGNWALGPSVGSNNNTMRASLTATPATFQDFTASATAGPPASVQAKAGNPTSGPVASTVSVTVVVRDAGGNLVTGAPVTFTPTNTPGTAAITSTNPVTTNASGEATVSWRLDTLSRTNTVSAVTNSVGTTLGVTGTPLAASKLLVISGNNQTNTPNTTLPQAPTVRVADQYNNGVSGANVTWAVAQGTVNCGAGAAASCQTTSSGTGLTSVTWTLGSSTNGQTLQVSLTASPTVTASFTTLAPCSPVTYTLGSTVNGTITTSDCASGSPATYSDFYRFTTASQTAVRISMTATTAFTPVFTGWYWNSNSAGIVFTGSGANSTVDTYAVVAAGTFDFEVEPSTAGTTGSYQVTSAVNPSVPVTNCSFMVTKGISHQFPLDAANCLYRSSGNFTTTDRSSRRYLLVLANGESVNVGMSGSLDNYLELYNLNTLALVQTANAGGAGAAESLAFTNNTGALQFYVLRATHGLSGSTDTAKSGLYTLTIAP